MFGPGATEVSGARWLDDSAGEFAEGEQDIAAPGHVPDGLGKGRLKAFDYQS